MLIKRKNKVVKNTKVGSNKKIYKDYYEIIEKANFVSFEQLIASAMLDNNISPDSEQVKEFNNKVSLAYGNKLDMVFNDFVITWNKNLRFSSTKNIPTIAEKESHNVESQNFIENEDDRVLNKLFKSYNKLIHWLVYQEKRYVELTKGIIVYLSRETEQLKIAFSEKSSDLNKE